MSQNYVAIDTSTTGDTVASAAAKTNNNFDALLTLHSGASAPTTTAAYMLWLDTSGASAVLKIRNGGDSGWITLFDEISKAAGTTPTGAGLVAASAGAFDTAAPTSATAASASNELTRKGEVDGRARVAVVRLGDMSATDNRYVFAGGPDATIVDVTLVSEAGTTSDGSNNWSFQIRNITAGNNLLSAAKSTNGAEITADTGYDLGVDQNDAITDGDVLQFQATLTGAPGNITEGLLVIRYTVETV